MIVNKHINKVLKISVNEVQAEWVIFFTVGSARLQHEQYTPRLIRRRSISFMVDKRERLLIKSQSMTSTVQQM
jgi:hypothetical protein